MLDIRGVTSPVFPAQQRGCSTEPTDEDRGPLGRQGLGVSPGALEGTAHVTAPRMVLRLQGS